MITRADQNIVLIKESKLLEVHRFMLNIVLERAEMMPSSYSYLLTNGVGLAEK